VARPLTVLQLLPALEGGGVERSTIEIAQALQSAGGRALVVSAGGRLLPQLLATGARHQSCPIGRKSLATLRHVWTLRRLIRRERPDVVHARSRLPAWLAWWALRGLPAAQRPVFVTTVHGLNSVGRYSAIMTRGERVIAVSDTVRAFLLRHYPIDPARIEVIPRGIDPALWPSGWQPGEDWRAAFDRQFPMLAGRRLLLLPGRGTRLKGHAEAIDLLARLVAAGRDVALFLPGVEAPGRAPYLAQLRMQARDLGVDGRLATSAARDDVRDCMARADIVLQLSSRPESFGRTVIEALALGRPVLGWNHGGVGELLAALYPRGAVALADTDALVARAAGLLDDPGAIAAPADFTLAAMQSRTLALYRRLRPA
jgi:glycosyltransferase involved in cell wall biosynthesis